MFSNKKAMMVVILLLIISLLTACGTTQAPEEEQEQVQEQEQVEPKTIVIAESVEWEGIDPYQVEWNGIVQTAHGEGLFTFDNETKEIVPSIASELKISDDKKNLTITIPEGLTFADGSAVTPEDIKRSIEWGLEVSPYNWDYMIIQEMKVDGNDLIITTEEFSSTVMYYLTNIYMSVMSKEQIDNTSAEELLLDSMQYGLFDVEEFVAGSHVTLVRDDGYKTLNPNVDNKGPALVEEIVCKFMPDGFSRVAGIKAGDIDIATGIPVENIQELKDDPNIELIMQPTPGMAFLTLNMDNPLFADINVRKAIAYALDRETIAETNNNYVIPTYSFIVPEMMDYSEELANFYKDTYSNDTDMALQLLADAGWADTDEDGYLDKDGEIFEFSLYASTESTYGSNTIQVMQMGFKDLGIKLEVGTAERGYLKEKMKTEDYDAIIHDFIWAEPASILPYLVYDSNNLLDESFYDKLMGAATIENAEERMEAFADAQKQWMEEFGYIPLLQKYETTAYRDDIVGVKFLFDGTMIFNDLDKQ
jgi:peptide/nickel transport system substrate-binding protein